MSLRVRLVLLAVVSFHAGAYASFHDSLKYNSYTWTFMPRFNTLNMAPVSGNIVNNHANFDFSFVYNRNRLMWTVADGVDLEDSHNEMNYLLTNIRYGVNMTKTLSCSPFLAFYSEHAHQLIDPISDANGGLIFSLQQGPVTVEAFFLLVRLTHTQAEKDLINRFEVRYKMQSLMFSGFVYQNTDYFDGRHRLAVGFKAILPEFKIVNAVNARAELTGSFRITENPQTTNLNGVFLSLAFPLRG